MLGNPVFPATGSADTPSTDNGICSMVDDVAGRNCNANRSAGLAYSFLACVCFTAQGDS